MDTDYYQSLFEKINSDDYIDSSEKLQLDTEKNVNNDHMRLDNIGAPSIYESSSDHSLEKLEKIEKVDKNKKSHVLNIDPNQLQCTRLQKYKPVKSQKVIVNENVPFYNENINNIDVKTTDKVIDENIPLMSITEENVINEDEAYRQLFMINYSGNDFGSKEYNAESNNTILSDMIPTTVTVKAALSNIYFNEKDLITRIKPDSKIKGIISNYGELYDESYKNNNDKGKKTNRGRKKIQKEPNKRKPQGTGKAFNSQTSLLIECDGRIYSIKVFRNGNLQFPGASQERFKAMLYCFQVIIDKFNELLYNDRHTIKLVKLEPAMKNYKYIVKMKENENLYLDELRNYLEKERHTSDIKIYQIKYGKDQSKLKLKFNTPSTNNVIKRLTINIFRSGKINVLGGLDENYTLKSYNFIKYIIGKYYHKIVYNPYIYEIDEPYEYVDLTDWHKTEQGRANKRNAILTSLGIDF